MRKSFFFFFFILVMISIVSATEYEPSYTEIIYNETFFYSDAYANHGWAFTQQCGTNPTVPSLSPYTLSNAFGFNGTSTCGITDNNRRIRRDLNQNLTTGTVIISFNYTNTIDSTSTSTLMLVQLKNRTAEAITGINLYINENADSNLHVDTSNHLNGQDCTVNIGTLVQNLTVYWELDFDTYTYSVYTPTLQLCQDLRIGDQNDRTFRLGATKLLTRVDPLENLTVAIDDFVIARGSVEVTEIGAISCDHPLLFCDDFDYSSSILDFGWTPFTGSFSIDDTLTPTGNELVLREEEFIRPEHTVSPFPVNYAEDSSITLRYSEYSPVFKSEFDLTVHNTTSTSCPAYAIEDKRRREVIDIRFCANGTVYYKDNVSVLNVLCSDCITAGTAHDISLITAFAQRPFYPFNSSVSQDEFSLNIDDSADSYLVKGLISNFLTENCEHFYFRKNEQDNITIDNYFVMIGTDRNIDTSTSYFTQFYEPQVYNATSIADTEQDLAIVLQDFWYGFGLRSTSSKFIFSMFILFFVSVVIVGFFIYSGSPMSGMTIGVVLVILNVLLTILLVYLQLLPVWIILLFIMLGGGLIIFIVKNLMT